MRITFSVLALNRYHLVCVCRSSEMDILPGTKLVNVVIGGLYGTVLFPVYVINDLNRGCISKNGLKFSDYGYKEKDTSLTDILFS